MNPGQAIAYLLFAALVFVGILLACRELTCWYFKINETNQLLKQILDAQKGVTPSVPENATVAEII